MSCGACAGHVTNALQNVEGVERAMVDLASNSAVVKHDASVSSAQLIEAVVEDGYEAEVA
jgi:Cu+-exporting ATPase